MRTILICILLLTAGSTQAAENPRNGFLVYRPVTGLHTPANDLRAALQLAVDCFFHHGLPH